MKSLRVEKQVNLKDLLLDGVSLLENAGVEIVKIRNSLDLFAKVKGKTKEGAKELMTRADLASHHIITTALKQHYKHLKVISEEHDGVEYAEEADIDYSVHNVNKINRIIVSDNDHVYNSDDLLVWVDPLDATQEYTENLTEYVTVMMCVAYKDRPILGIIHQPFQKNTYWAYRSRDSRYLSWKMGSDEEENDDVKNTPDHTKRIGGGAVGMLVSRSHAGEVKGVIERGLKGEKVNVIAAGGAGYKALQTLTNASLSYLHTTNIKKWDICAPDALASISGGRTSDLRGFLIGYSEPQQVVNQHGLLITNKHSLYSHDFLLRRLQPSAS